MTTANEGERERCVLARRQNKSPVSNTLAKQKNDADILKMPDIGRYIGWPLICIKVLVWFLRL